MTQTTDTPKGVRLILRLLQIFFRPRFARLPSHLSGWQCQQAQLNALALVISSCFFELFLHLSSVFNERQRRYIHVVFAEGELAGSKTMVMGTCKHAINWHDMRRETCGWRVHFQSREAVESEPRKKFADKVRRVPDGGCPACQSGRPFAPGEARLAVFQKTVTERSTIHSTISERKQ